MKDKTEVHASAMTMRDYFAGEVLSGVVSRVAVPSDELIILAQYAHAAADAMMKARNNKAESEDGTADSEDDWEEIESGAQLVLPASTVSTPPMRFIPGTARQSE
jgi:hypothetical protein